MIKFPIHLKCVHTGNEYSFNMTDISTCIVKVPTQQEAESEDHVVEIGRKHLSNPPPPRFGSSDIRDNGWARLELHGDVRMSILLPEEEARSVVRLHHELKGLPKSELEGPQLNRSFRDSLIRIVPKWLELRPSGYFRRVDKEIENSDK